jgi:hypothetical protein
MKRIELSIFVLTIILLTSFRGKDGYFGYPNEIGIIQTCEGQEVEFMIDIEVESNKKVKVHSFSTDKSEFTISLNDKVLTKNDTIVLSKKSSISLKVNYKINSAEKPTKLTFMTNMDKYITNHINLNYGRYEITSQDIKEGKEQFINVSESCQDSIKMSFPYGGTISSVSLFSDSSQIKKKYKSISYELMDTGNYFTLSKADIGRYYVNFGSCHWGNSFWLTIK